MAGRARPGRPRGMGGDAWHRRRRHLRQRALPGTPDQRARAAVRLLAAPGEVIDVPASAMGFGYDRSRIQDSGEVVLSVLFEVTPGATPEALRAAARTSLAFRKRTQPLAPVQCRLHLPESRRGRAGPCQRAAIGGRAHRSRRAQGRAGRRGRGLGAARQFHCRCAGQPRCRRAGARRPLPYSRRRRVAACAWTRRSSTWATGTIHGKVSADMSVLRVQGGRRLEGVVTVEGNKNAALPLIVASLLTTEPVTLHNVPRIRDVDVLLDLLRGLGSTVEGQGTSTLVLRGADQPGATPDPPARRTRARVAAVDGAAAGAMRRRCTWPRRAVTSPPAGRSRRMSRHSRRSARGPSRALRMPSRRRTASSARPSISTRRRSPRPNWRCSRR